MRWFRLRPGSREALSGEVDEEIGLHLDLRASALMREGLSEPEARAEAIRRFGTGAGTRAGLFAAAARRERGRRKRERWDGLRRDAGYAVRAVVREPGFSTVIVLTLALGIGANALMFGVIDRLLLRGPAHVESPADLYRFYVTVQAGESGELRTTDGLGYVSYTTFRDGTRSFEGVAAYSRTTGTVGRGTTAERAVVGSATADFFPLTGVRASLGRFFDAAEDRPLAATNVAVLSYELWQRRFGGDRGALGASVIVNDETFTVIGVAPPGFTGVELAPVDVWLPMSVQSRGITADWPVTWYAQWLRVVGRLRRDVSPDRAAMDATAAYRAAYAGSSERGRDAAVSIRPPHYSRRGRKPLEVIVAQWLLAVTAIVLVIASANVMNLLLARSARRRRDIAVRLAMGIGRGRLFRLLLMHGLALAVAGGVLALLIVAVAGPVARSVLLPDIAWYDPPVHGRVLSFTMIAALLTGVLTTVVPAVRAGRQDLARELRSGVREGGGRRSRLRMALTLAQVTLTFVLLVGAGLFARSLSAVRSLDLGIEADRVLSLEARWAAPASAAAPATAERSAAERERRIAYYARALERVRSLPAVASAAVAIGTPFGSSFTIHVRAAGHDSIDAGAGGGPYVSAVTDGYFETTGIDVLEGRPFGRGDRAGSEPVAIVNRTMANALWPGGALGKCLYLVEGDADAPCSRVVGVVEDAIRFGLREPPAMQYYIPHGQERRFGGEELLVRPAGQTHDPALIASLGDALFALDAGLSFVSVVPMQNRIDPQVRPWELGAALFSLFGGLAFLIAVVGLYSVIAYMVVDRTHEMGVRKALGAGRGALLGLILRHTVLHLAAGLVLGTLIALVAGRFIEPALFETSARDPAVFTTVATLTIVASLAAGMVPAWRAGRVDPLIALRTD